MGAKITIDIEEYERNFKAAYEANEMKKTIEEYNKNLEKIPEVGDIWGITEKSHNFEIKRRFYIFDIYAPRNIASAIMVSVCNNDYDKPAIERVCLGIPEFKEYKFIEKCKYSLKELFLMDEKND